MTNTDTVPANYVIPLPVTLHSSNKYHNLIKPRGVPTNLKSLVHLSQCLAEFYPEFISRRSLRNTSIPRLPMLAFMVRVERMQAKHCHK